MDSLSSHERPEALAAIEAASATLRFLLPLNLGWRLLVVLLIAFPLSQELGPLTNPTRFNAFIIAGRLWWYFSAVLIGRLVNGIGR